MKEKQKIDLDAVDRRILAAVQSNCAVTISELAEIAGLSATPCWNRIKRMEEAGVIERRVALLNRQLLGHPVTVFASVRTSHHEDEWFRKFATGVSSIPEVVEFYRLSGEADYLLKIICRSIEHYDEIYKRIIKIAPLFDVSSSFSMEQIKYTTELPI